MVKRPKRTPKRASKRVGQLYRAGIERGGHGHGLEGRAEFVDARGDAVEALVLLVHPRRRKARRRVGVEIGQRHHRHDFAGMDVDHDAGRGDGLVARQGIEQVARAWRAGRACRCVERHRRQLRGRGRNRDPAAAPRCRGPVALPMPAMPWLSILTMPMMCDASGPPG